MPKLVIELNTDHAKSYCGRVCDWLTSFPVCRSCQKGEQGSFRYVREKEGDVGDGRGGGWEKTAANGTHSVKSSAANTPSAASAGYNGFPGYPTQQSYPGQPYHNSGFFETDEVIIFDLATPETIKNAANAAAIAQATPIPDVVPRTKDEEQQQIFRIQESKSLQIERTDLQFTRSIGRGWFGWIVEGQLLRRTTTNTTMTAAAAADNSSSELAPPPTHDSTANYETVVAQILKEEATPSEQERFREECRGQRLLLFSCPNVLGLVGTCTDSLPHVQLFEVCSFGDLRAYLRQRVDQLPQLQDDGLLLKFCKQITSGVSALHSVGVIPTDLALRCCQLTAEMNVKVGDYGLASTHYLEDYVPVNGDNQPIRWMPPEVLAIMDRTKNALDSSSDDDDDDAEVFVQAAEIPWTPRNGVWSLAVTLWEVTTSGADRPFDQVSDHQFVVTAVGQPLTLMAMIGDMRIKGVEAEAIQSVIDLCFKLDPNSRPDCERLDRYLTDLYECKIEEQKLQQQQKQLFANFDQQRNIINHNSTS